ncbi:MAG: hypothetical protein Q3979_09590 [Actinomycetaceae bacterium]|nr:hypothetical protein [Actinomycetaceae bacterium]
MESFFRRLRAGRDQNWLLNQGFSFIRLDGDLGREVGAAFDMWDDDTRYAQNVVVMPPLSTIPATGSCLYGQIVRVDGSAPTGKENPDGVQTTPDFVFMRYELKAPLPSFLAKREDDSSDISAEWHEFNRWWEIQASDQEHAQALLLPVMQESISFLRNAELRLKGRFAYLRFPKDTEYDMRASLDFRDVVADWEDWDVPYLWQEVWGRVR